MTINAPSTARRAPRTFAKYKVFRDNRLRKVGVTECFDCTKREIENDPIADIKVVKSGNICTQVSAEIWLLENQQRLNKASKKPKSH